MLRRQFLTLLSILLLIAVTEGIVLCKNKAKSTSVGNNGRMRKDADQAEDSFAGVRLQDNFYRSGMNKAYALDEDLSQRAEEKYNDDSYRKDSLENKIRAALIMDDSAAMRASDGYQDYSENFRAENAKDDYSALEDLLRADTYKEEAVRKNLAASNSDESDRRFASYDFLLNRWPKKQQTRGEEILDDDFRQNGWAKRNYGKIEGRYDDSYYN